MPIRNLLVVLLLFASLKGSAKDFNILQCGAVGDGKTINTGAIQHAIDACAITGGDRVIIPVGSFLTGSLHLKNGVELHLEKGALLLGSTNRSDYEKNVWYALLLAKDQHDISITGEGIIDGQGRELAKDVIRMLAEGELPQKNRKARPDEQYRPQIIDFWNCRKVKISGITIKNSACWVETYHQCDTLTIDHIRVESTAYWNNDGIDIVDCRNVRVTNSYFNAADDGICLKSESRTAFCEHIVIQNCKIRSSASGLKLGTASYGGFRDVRIKNLYIWDTYRSAIALECVDGGFLEDIVADSITAKNIGNAFFIRRGQRDRSRPPGIVKNIIIRNLRAIIPAQKPDKGYEMEGPEVKEPHNLFPSSIMGLPGYPVQDVTLQNIDITFAGGGRTTIANRPIDSLAGIPERAANYPEFSMLGELPAWGFYARHAGNIQIRNFRLHLTDADYRQPFLFDDVKVLKMKNVRISGKSETKIPVIFRGVEQAELNGLGHIVLP